MKFLTFSRLYAALLNKLPDNIMNMHACATKHWYIPECEISNKEFSLTSSFPDFGLIS